MSVTGEGTVAAAPDTGRVQLGVEVRGATAGAALAANAERMQQVMETLAGAGIAERDIQTSRFDVQPEYARQEPRSQEPPRIVGYRVSNQVSIRVRELERIGSVLDTVVGAGANRIHGLHFSVAEPEALLAQARTRAAANARARAETYAKAGGFKIVRVLRLSEGSQGPSPGPGVAMRAMSMEAASTPVAQGEQEFRVRVNVTYQIE